MPKPNKQTYIDFILNELNKGNVQYKDVYLAFLSNFKCTEPTFVKYWKIANETYKEQRKAINEAKTEESIRLEKEAVKRDILSKHDAMEILTEIAKGKPKKIEGQIVMPTFADRRNAIDSLAKLEGWNAPTKQETDINFSKDVVINIGE